MILETKLTLPQPKAGALLRTGLLELIKNNLDKKLILITAGAGYGKTTLLGQLVREAQLPYVFVHLDKGDSDLMSFFSYLCAGLEKQSPGLAVRSFGLLESGAAGGSHELLMGTLINELVEKRKEELFIILDDYQHLTGDSRVHQALDYFIDHQPDIVHVIIAARGAVDFPSLSKWIAKQDAFTLDRERLAFMPDETKALLAKNYEVVTEEDIRQILDHTEGWITGIQLIMRQTGSGGQKLSINEIISGYRQTKPAVAAGEELFRYFVKEIFARETQPVRDFLAKTSILETANPEICDALLEIGHSMKLLDDLEKRNIFIFRVGALEYKYHRLFRDFLQKQMPDADERKLLHVKAAEYYESQGMKEQAIEHYLAGQSYQKAATAIAETANQLELAARFTTLESWLKPLPPEILEKEPVLLLDKGVLLQEQGLVDEAERMFVLSEKATNDLCAGATRSYDTAWVLAEGLIMHSLLCRNRGDSRQALALLSRALRIRPAANADLRAEILNMMGLIWQALNNYGKAKACLLRAKRQCAVVKGLENTYKPVMIESNLAQLHVRLGDLKPALAVYKSLFERIQGKFYWGVGAFYANAAVAAIMAGEAGWAEKCLEQGWELCRPRQDFRSLAALHNGFGILYIQKMQWEKAGRHLEDAYTEWQRQKISRGAMTSLVNLIRLNRYTGNFKKALDYIDLVRQKQEKPEGVMWNQLQMESALVKSGSGQHQPAAAEIKESLSWSKKHGFKIEEFQVGLALAAIYSNRGDASRAGRLLGRLVRTAKARGYHGILIRELQTNSKLADLAFQCRSEKKYLDALRLSARAPGADLRLCLFGPLQLRRADGREIPLKWRREHSAALFAYLLMHRSRICDREELMEALWPRLAVKQAEKILWDAVYSAKKSLAAGLRQAGQSDLASRSLIVHHDNGYGLAPDFPLGSDVDDFMQNYEAARDYENRGQRAECLDAWRRCVALYRQDFLSNLGQAWCEDHRQRCQSIYLTLLQKLASIELENGGNGQAIDYCRRYLLKDPYSEEMHAALWQALKAMGKMGEIKVDYSRLRRLVWKDLREKLRPETKKAFKDIFFDKGQHKERQ